MASRRAELITNQPDGWMALGGELIKATQDLEPRGPRVVDPRPNGDELTGDAQLIDKRRRDAEASCHRIGGRGQCPGSDQGRKQLLDPLAHDLVEQLPSVGQPHAMTDTEQGSRLDHAVHHATQVRVGQGQRLLPAMASGARRLRRPELGDQRVDAKVRPKR